MPSSRPASEPIEPTRIWPGPGAGTAPGPGELPPGPPPWWSAPPPVPAEIIVRIEYGPPVPPAPQVPAGPSWEWSRLWSWIRGRHWTGVLAALAPVFGGRSLATGWGAQLQDCREQANPGGAWTLGLIVLAVAITTARWRPRWYTAAAVTTALFGLAAQAVPYDLVTLITGVHA